MLSTREKGNIGESIAVDYLLGLGWKICKRNFYTKFGELDIVALDLDKVLVFVEVKSKNRPFIDPLENMTKTKQTRLLLAAKYYLMRFHEEEPSCRFDFIRLENNIITDHLKNIMSE